MHHIRLMTVLFLWIGLCGAGSAQETNAAASGVVPTNSIQGPREKADAQDVSAFKTRVIRIQPGTAEIILGRGSQVGQTTNEQAAINSFFLDTGVPLPEGAAIFYSSRDHALVVHGPDITLSRMESVIFPHTDWPYQVEITARFIEIGQRRFAKAGIDRLIEQKAPVAPTDQTTTASKNLASLVCLLPNREQHVLRAIEAAGGVTIAVPRVTTKSGANAEIKAAKEIIYPTAIAGKLETRDVGVVLNVTPVVGPDGYTIDLTILPHYVELVGWQKYRLMVAAEDGSLKKAVLRQPVFRSISVATSIELCDGQTMMMGGVPMGEVEPSFIGRLFGRKPDRKLLFLFITARLVDCAGRPMN